MVGRSVGLAVLFLAVAVTVSPCRADTSAKPSVHLYVTYAGGAVPGAAYDAGLLHVGPRPGWGHTFESPAGRDAFDRYERETGLSVDGWMWEGVRRGNYQTFAGWPPSELRVGAYVPALRRFYATETFTRVGFNSSITVDLAADGRATVTRNAPVDGRLNGVLVFLLSLGLTACLEYLVARAGAAEGSGVRMTEPGWRRFRYSVLYVNALVHPLAWFLLPLAAVATGTWQLYLEPPALALEMVAEALGLVALNEGRFRAGEAFVLSFWMNLVSWSVGGFLLLLFQLI